MMVGDGVFEWTGNLVYYPWLLWVKYITIEHNFIFCKIKILLQAVLEIPARNSAHFCPNSMDFFTCVLSALQNCPWQDLIFFSKLCLLRTTTSHYSNQNAGSFTIPCFDFVRTVYRCQVTYVMYVCFVIQLRFFFLNCISLFSFWK